MNGPMESDLPEPLEGLLVHRAWVRRLALAMARDADEAGDLEQDAWLAALRSGPTESEKARPWFRTVLRRLIGRRRRGERRRDAREMAVARPEREGGASPVDSVAAAESLRALVDAVLALEEPSRSTVLMRWFEGLTPPEIAARRNEPLETVRTRLRRALDRLRRSLDPSGGSDGGRGLRAVLLPILVAPEGALPWGAGAATPATAGVASTTTSTALQWGGLLVAKKGLAAAGVLAVLLLAGGSWWLLGTGGESGGIGGESAHGGARVSESAAGSGASDDESTTNASVSSRPRADTDTDAHPPGGTVSGRIFDSRESPVRGAVVRLRWFEDGRERTASAEGDANGRYRLAPPEGFVSRMSGPAFIEVDAPGFAPLVIPTWSLVGGPFQRAAHGDDGEQDFLMVAASATLGHVLDEATGRPVPGARVVVWTNLSAHHRGARASQQPGVRSRVFGEARTGSDGSFLLSGLPARGYQAAGAVLIAAIAGGRPPRILDWTLPSPGEVTELVLHIPSSAVVTGRVEEADGTPAAGVHVSVSAVGERPPPEVPGVPQAAHAVTGADGRYRVDGIAARERSSRHFVLAERRTEGIVGWPPSVYVETLLRAGETVEAPFHRLPASRILSARILATDAVGRPVPGAEVFAGGSIGRTDVEGAYLLRWTLLQQATPITVEVRSAAGVGRVDVILAEEPAVFEVVLEPGRSLAGRVVDFEGRSVPSASVTLVEATISPERLIAFETGTDSEWPGEEYRFVQSAQTRADGSVRFESLRDTPVHAVVSMHIGGPHPLAAVAASVRPGGEPFLVRLDLPKMRSVTLQVRDGGAEKSLGVPFTARLQREESYHFPDVIQPGRCRWSRVPEGIWRLDVTATGFDPVSEEIAFEATESTNPHEVTVTLQPDGRRSPGLTVEGRVRLAAGTSPAGRVLLLRPAGPVSMLQRTGGSVLDGNGRFTLRAMRPGPYRVEVLSAGAEGDGPPAMVAVNNATVEIVEGDPPPALDLSVVPGGSLLLRIGGDRGTTETNGLPPPTEGRRWEVRSGDGAVARGETLHRLGSAFVAIPLAPGKYVVALFDGLEILREMPANIRPGDEVEVVF